MGLTYLDISKAFDVVPFACLSHKLEIRMSTVKTLEELTKQRQVVLEGKVSGWVYEQSSSRIHLGDGSYLIFS